MAKILRISSVVTHKLILLTQVESTVSDHRMCAAFTIFKRGFKGTLDSVSFLGGFYEHDFAALISKDEMAIRSNNRSRAFAFAAGLASQHDLTASHPHINRKTFVMFVPAIDVAINEDHAAMVILQFL